MPATEQTWRDQRLLHAIFAVSGVLMLLATVWMFQADHSRQWKNTQRTYIDVDTRITSWRNQAVAAEAEEKHVSLMSRLLSVRSQPVKTNLLADFQREANAGAGKKADLEKVQALGETSQQQGERAAALRALTAQIEEAVSLQRTRTGAAQTQQAATAGAAVPAAAEDQQAIADRASALAKETSDLAARAGSESGVKRRRRRGRGPADRPARARKRLRPGGGSRAFRGSGRRRDSRSIARGDAERRLSGSL
jgi:hypothetical protein